MNERINGSKMLVSLFMHLVWKKFSLFRCVCVSILHTVFMLLWLFLDAVHAIHRPIGRCSRFKRNSHITNGDWGTLNSISVNRGTCLNRRTSCSHLQNWLRLLILPLLLSTHLVHTHHILVVQIGCLFSQIVSMTFRRLLRVKKICLLYDSFSYLNNIGKKVQ